MEDLTQARPGDVDVGGNLIDPFGQGKLLAVLSLHIERELRVSAGGEVRLVLGDIEHAVGLELWNLHQRRQRLVQQRVTDLFIGYRDTSAFVFRGEQDLLNELFHHGVFEGPLVLECEDRWCARLTLLVLGGAYRQVERLDVDPVAVDGENLIVDCRSRLAGHVHAHLENHPCNE